MSIGFFFLYFGPIVILLALGFVSIVLTFGGYFPGRTQYGWGLLAVAVTVFLVSLVIHAGTGEINFATVVSFLYILFLTGLLGLQAPLIAELIAQATLPDPSRNLRPLKVHTTAERKVAEQDLPGAIAEYEKIVADDPKDIDARFRLAELCCEHEEYRKAVAVYEALLGHPRKLGIGQHCSMLTRLSEIYARHLGDPTMARKYVQTIIDTHPGTKYAEYAEARLSNL